MNQIKRDIKGSIRNLIIILPITFLSYFVFINFTSKISFPKLIEELYPDILFGLLLITIGFFIRYFRWRVILKSFGYKPKIKEEIKVWFASFAFTATPGKVGELLRCFFLKRLFNIPKLDSFLSLVIERIGDLSAVFFICLIFFAFNIKNFLSNFYLNKNLLLILIFTMVTIIYFRNIIKNIFMILIKKCLKIINKYIPINKIESIKKNKEIRKLESIIFIIFLSISSWMLESFAFYLLLRNYSNDVSILDASFTHISSGIIGAISLIPGGLGFTEATTVALLNIKSIPLDIAIPITTLIRSMTLWYITFIGIICLIKIRKKII